MVDESSRKCPMRGVYILFYQFFFSRVVCKTMQNIVTFCPWRFEVQIHIHEAKDSLFMAGVFGNVLLERKFPFRDKKSNTEDIHRNRGMFTSFGHFLVSSGTF